MATQVMERYCPLKGARVKVVDVRGLTLVVEPVDCDAGTASDRPARAREGA
jgi:hypothetical protein